jgi:hypothetical protein
MPQSQPPSIFSNISTVSLHRLSQNGTASAPCTPLEEHPTPPHTQQPSWTPTLRLDLGASITRPPAAPLHNSGGRGAIASPKTPPAVAGKKRPLPATADVSEALHKRRRQHAFSRRSLDLAHFPKSAHFYPDGQPPSPLFFSSRSPRPLLPARFSSSEAAARMLSKTGEEGGIKTVTLARGSFNGLSPPPAPSVTDGRSSERSSLPPTTSPDARDRNDPLKLLGSVSIIELLEQDTRPTFIVDVADAANHLPELSLLHILFANSALRSSAATWTLVAGKPTGQELDQSTALASHHFRSWLLSSTFQADNPIANPSPIEHGGVIWSCYTLRKRLRVVSGAVPTHAVASITPATGPHEFPIPSTSSVGDISGNSILKSSSSSMHKDEPQDYFGTTGPADVEQRLSPLKQAQQGQLQNAPVTARDVSGIFQKSADITMPTEDATFSNECVLLAHTAADVDPFYREPNTPHERDMGFFDWTRLPLTASLPRHIQFARSIDWASTPLGPIELWSNDLRAMCNLIM